MFVDLVNSTALLLGAGPDDSTEVIRQFRSVVTRTVTEFGGYVGPFPGDGALIYFGYPQAHEDDAEQAVRAALRTVEAFSEFTLSGGRRIQAHIGIATGKAVVGDIVGDGDPSQADALGAPLNLASRLQELAPAGTVLVAESTYRLVHGSFEWRDLGHVRLRNVPDPERVFEVTGARFGDGRFDARHRGALLPMVNRQRELALLTGLWREAQQGACRIAVISGEAGIGKSRLTVELMTALEGKRHVRLRYFGSEHRKNSPLFPCVQQLEHAAGFARGDSAEKKVAKLVALLQGTSEQELALIADLLLLTGSPFPTPKFAPQRKRERLMQALIGLVERAARTDPVLMILEDAQWIDASTRDLLAMFASRVAGHPILCVVTARPEFEASWMQLPHVHWMGLTPLGPEDSAILVRQVAGADSVPPAAVEDIIWRTDGVPLYVEEMTRAVIEGGGDAGPSRQPAARTMVPASLQASLLARLDRLGEAREIAEIAAAIGREFTRELLTRVAGCPPNDVRAALEQLVQAGLVVRRPTFSPGETGFGFRHMLIRDAAYEVMVRKRRQSVHASIATALESHFQDRTAANPEIVAYHCSEGGLAEKAAGYWLAAGQQALQRSAMAEALTHLGRGLEALQALPDSRWLRECKLKLTVALGKAQIATQGYAVPSTGETFERARVLCEGLGEPPQLLSVLHGLWTHSLMRADLQSARKQALDLLARGEERQDPLWRLMGCRFSGVTHHPLGAFDDACKYLGRGIELYEPARSGEYAMITVDDPRVVMLTYLSWSLMCMGRLDEARQRGVEALQSARGHGHPFTVAHALNGASFLALTIDSPGTALHRLDELMPLIEENGIAYYGAVGTLFRGWCLAALGESQEAEALLRDGMSGYRATGSRLYLPGFLRMSAEANARIGRLGAALEHIHEAFQLMYLTSQHWDEAEIHRVHGALLLGGGDRDGAIAAFRRALAIARGQRAGLWELRAARDLARLEAEQGERQRARELLAPVCESFEGQSDAPDLREARALVESLA